MSRPLWFVKLLEKIYPSRFFVARATHVPIIGRFFDHWLFEGDDVMFLPGDGAVRTIEVNQALDMPEEIVLPSQVVEHFIEQANVHWVMDFCLCREAEGCQDYPTDLGCLFLGEAALGINPQLGHRVTKEEALEHLRRCREAGLVHFIGRHKLDTVWLGIGPGTKLLTICNCCPCCCLWTVLPHVTPLIGRKVKRMPGVTVSVNGRCEGCGTCTQGVCFVEAIHLVDGHAAIGDGCRGCGRCVDVCPQRAIEIHVEDGRFVEEAIAQISPLVDVS
jgi:NAD-dependent dihydropyrimidine dehydrogenase PreA subunit